MKTRSYLIFAICALIQSCNMVDAQIIWLSTKNMDFRNCDREEREVKYFDAISNTCPFDVIYEQTDKQYVIVEGDEEYFSRIHTDVVRGVLEIKIDPARYRNVRLRVKVGCPEITQITMNGSGSIQCVSDIEAGDDFILKVSGSGDITARQIKCSGIETSVTGSGDISIAEIVGGDVNVSVTGSGDWTARSVKAVNLNIALAGSGDIDITEVDIEDTMSATVAGSGDIEVNGKAANVKAKVTGSGDISGRVIYDHITKIKTGSGDLDW